MIRKLTKLIRKNQKQQKQIYFQTKELEWAHVFHDSIKGKEWLLELPLNIGRWAGNYCFFYLLGRILSDYKPKAILELGLGESSKFVSTFLKNELLVSEHLIIEQSSDWEKAFNQRFNLSERSKVHVCDLVTKTHQNKSYYGYEGIGDLIKDKYELYIVDGPLGSENFSRFDIVGLCAGLTSDDEFIIIFDDYNREGEKETVEELYKQFRNSGIKVNTATYQGNKSVLVIASNKYKYATSL